MKRYQSLAVLVALSTTVASVALAAKVADLGTRAVDGPIRATPEGLCTAQVENAALAIFFKDADPSGKWDSSIDCKVSTPIAQKEVQVNCTSDAQNDVYYVNKGPIISTGCKVGRVTADTFVPENVVAGSAPTLDGETWASGNTGLTISKGAATIQFTCGNVTVANWHADGQPMQGMDHMGPMEAGPGTPTKVVAKFYEGEMYVHVGTGAGSQYVFTQGERAPGEFCR